uniref:Uncharacterized protein n=1 Tax=Myoviridae sp. ctw4b6 TaxID=2825206 RepID=A0A8S5QCV4_9CAUD|nr:MAG TPA: hypothetical protein [Myoviridae sp. ctw4b6]
MNRLIRYVGNIYINPGNPGFFFMLGCLVTVYSRFCFVFLPVLA